MLEAHFAKKLDSFTLEIDLTADREAVALLGGSGEGKSMTLKCLAGVETPDSGFIILDGQTLFDAQKHINLPPQQRNIGLLFQNYALFPTMTVQQNILCGLRKTPKAQRAAACAELVWRFRLEGLEKRLPSMLSGGQQQRAALARMLAASPRLLLLDEPFSALDGFLRWELEQTAAEVIAAHGGETLLVSHNREEAYRLCDRIAVVEKGKIEINKPKHMLFAEPETQAGARLIGCENIENATFTDGMLTIPAWSLQVPVPQRPVYPVGAAGVPADALVRTEGATEPNSFAATVQKIMECPHDVELLVQPANSKASMRWRTDKQTGLALQSGDTVRLAIQPARIFLLR